MVSDSFFDICRAASVYALAAWQQFQIQLQCFMTVTQPTHGYTQHSFLWTYQHLKRKWQASDAIKCGVNPYYTVPMAMLRDTPSCAQFSSLHLSNEAVSTSRRGHAEILVTTAASHIVFFPIIILDKNVRIKLYTQWKSLNKSCVIHLRLSFFWAKDIESFLMAMTKNFTPNIVSYIITVCWPV